MNFAVVRLAGKQHLVTDNARITVDGDLGKADEVVSLSEVLLLGSDAGVQIGTPLVSGAKLSAKIVSAGKGDKVAVRKFKAKSRYRRHVGFRPTETVLQVIAFGDVKEAKTESKAPKAEATKPAAKKAVKAKAS